MGTTSGEGPASPSSRGPEQQGKGWDQVAKVCREILGPLVHADGGEMYLVSVSGEDVHIHLSGTCSGCPGAALTRDRVLSPVVQSALPKARLLLTTGVRIPDGALKIEEKPTS
jgi:Fe-S cluster biogenesis protein NfuA